MKCRFFWDFFGPHAQKTGEHFLVHLQGFLNQSNLELPCGLEQEGEAHVAVYCDLMELPARLNGASEENTADRVGAALRPNRLVQLPPNPATHCPD